MRNLGAKEAADAIRSTVEADHAQRVDPRQAHQIRYVAQVCSELGLEASAENVHHVATVLREKDIDLHAGHEYPKWVGEGTSARVVNDEAEEHAYHNPPPAAESAAGAAEGSEFTDPLASNDGLVGHDQVHVEEIDNPIRFADEPESKPDPAPPRKRPM